MNQNLAKNFLASIVIFLVALPLNLGIAYASGVDPVVGLLSGIVAGIVVGFMAGCPLQVSGPAAGLIAMVWQITQAHSLAMLGPIVLAAGVLQIALGASGLAPWFRAVAPSVIQGMLAGIGVLIFASQFLVMLALKSKPSGLTNLSMIPGGLWSAFTTGAGLASFAIGVLTIGVIVAWSWIPKRFQVVPGSLVGVASAVLAAFIFQPKIAYVVLPTKGLPELSLLSWSQIGGLASPSVLGSVLALAFIATAQTLLTATAIDRMHDLERTNYNKEVIAQGFGNSICGLLGLLPISGVIVRSATNVEAGATGRVSAVMHGIWVLLFLVFFAPLLGYVPLSALAAVLVYTGYRLVNIKAIKELSEFGRAEFAIYAITLVTVVTVDLLTGIIAGFVFSAAHLIYNLTHCDISVWKHKETGATVVELQGSATFVTLPKLADNFAALPPGQEVHLFLSGLNHIDHACLEHIMGWEELYIQGGGEVYIEWDHLIHRLRSPLTTELKRTRDEGELPTTREHESYDVLASRARILDLNGVDNWDDLSTLLVDKLKDTIPEEQLLLVQKELEEQFEKMDFPVVDRLAMPHLMVPGLARHELSVVRIENVLQTSNDAKDEVEAIVLLTGPKEYTEHLNIMARLSNRAEEGLAPQLKEADSDMAVRETLLGQDGYVTVNLEEGLAANELVGKALWQLGKELLSGCLVAKIERNGESFVPVGSTKLEQGDRLLILGSKEATKHLFQHYVQGTTPVEAP